MQNLKLAELHIVNISIAILDDIHIRIYNPK